MRFHINDACWDAYDQDMLFDLMEKHPLLFPNHIRHEGVYVPEFDLVARKDEPFTDDFGCIWETSTDGITGTVSKHPIKTIEDYKTYVMPDYNQCMGIGPVDWVEEAKLIEKAKKDFGFAEASLRHGHTFFYNSLILEVIKI